MRTEFVTGNAGTGKTTLIKQRIEKNPKDSILCASTGIAAINLNTITIHSLLRFFDLKSMTDAYTSGKLLLLMTASLVFHFLLMMDSRERRSYQKMMKSEDSTNLDS